MEQCKVAVISIVESGGHQYLVKKGQVIKVEKIDLPAGSPVQLKVLSYFGSQGTDLFCKRAVVNSEILEQTKGEKLVIFKKRRRKSSRRKNGHRQFVTVLRVGDLVVDSDEARG